MKREQLAAKERLTLGKNASKQIRKQGIVPAVIYGQQMTPVHITVDVREISRLYRLHGANKNLMISLSIESAAGKPREEVVISRDIKINALTRQIEHIDFFKLDLSKPIRTEVPLHFVGVSPGVKKGGTLFHKTDRIKISSLPENVPDFIEVNLSSLDIDQSLKAKDLPSSDLYQITATPDDILAYVESVKAAVEEPAAAGAATAPAAEAKK